MLATSVLVVDDDATNRLVAESMLRHLGVAPDFGTNGAEGVRLASQHRYEVVLMDVQMPVMDGIEAMRSIRTLLPPEDCPQIVAVTAFAVSGTRERLLAAGFDAFYTKPISIALLRDALTMSDPSASHGPAFVAGRPPAPGAASALLNDVRAHVRALIGEDDEEFVQDLIGAFASSSRQAASDAASASASGDAQGVAAAAHALKGSASNVGLTGLADAWGGIENAIRSGVPLPTGNVDRALAETDQAVSALEAA